MVGARLDEFCESHDVPPQVAYAVNVSVDELLNNTISYGYPDDARHTIELSARVDDGAVVVEIVDDGQEFEASGVPEPDTDAALEDRARGRPRSVHRPSDDGPRGVSARGRAQRRHHREEDRRRALTRRPWRGALGVSLRETPRDGGVGGLPPRARSRRGPGPAGDAQSEAGATDLPAVAARGRRAMISATPRS